MIRLENVLKISLQDVLKTSWRCLEDVFQDILKTFWRRLQNVLKTSWRWLEDVFARCLEDVLKTYWRCLEDVLKTSWRRLAKTNILVLTKTSWRRKAKPNIFVLIKTSSRHLQDVFWRRRRKTSSTRRMFAGLPLYYCFITTASNLPSSSNFWYALQKNWFI